MMKNINSILFLLLFSVLFSTEMKEKPWFTGPLIAPQGEVIPYGNILFKSYLFFEDETGAYNNRWETVPNKDHLYHLSIREYLFIGLTPWCDLNVITPVFCNFRSKEKNAQFGDLTAGLDIQLLAPDETPFFPGIKLAIREQFPTGNFQDLGARKLNTNLTGKGTFATQFDLVLYKIFHLHDLYWLTITFSNQCTINTPVSVRGFNAYGGGFGTKGLILPGNIFTTIFSFELSLSRHLALSLDSIYTYRDPNRFQGQRGISLQRNIANVGNPHSKELSFAPSIEANFSPHFGIIGGCYFSAIGKNCTQFQSAVINFNYLY